MWRGPPYWFPIKRYGWGWGLPNCWQGWVVLGVYLALQPIGALIFPPHLRLTEFLIHVYVTTLSLIVVCWLKGEPPRWRWGR
jgi:hypothetical protein